MTFHKNFTSARHSAGTWISSGTLQNHMCFTRLHLSFTSSFLIHTWLICFSGMRYWVCIQCKFILPFHLWVYRCVEDVRKYIHMDCQIKVTRLNMTRQLVSSWHQTNSHVSARGSTVHEHSKLYWIVSPWPDNFTSWLHNNILTSNLTGKAKRWVNSLQKTVTMLCDLDHWAYLARKIESEY